MSHYPIQVRRDGYRGGDERRRRQQREYNELATMLEDHINRKVEANPEPIQTFIYGYIANELGIPVEDVRRVLYCIDGGHNGFSVVKEARTGTSNSSLRT